jgi:hypothetical protein
MPSRGQARRASISIIIAVFETILLKTSNLLRILARSVSIAQAPGELVPAASLEIDPPRQHPRGPALAATPG